MADQGYPSKRHRSRDQRRQKRSHSQPLAAATSTQTINPVISADYSMSSQPLNQAEYWEECGADNMDWQHDGSQKLGSISSLATTYLNTDTPSGVTGMGGYVMINNPSSGAYSNGSGSNKTSEEASEPGQQAYYSPPWTPGAEYLVDREAVPDFQLPGHDFLLDLGNQKLQLEYDHYNTYASSSSLYQETPGNYTYQTSATESSSPLPKQDVSSPPWNQNNLRVPRYEPGFAAFEGLSPEPETLKNIASSRKSKPDSRAFQKKTNSRSPNGITEPKRNEKAVSPGWEHIVIRKGGLTTVSERKDEEHHGTGGRRKGKLEKEVKEKAARVRKVKACWNCWLLKVPCSEGETCERCLKYCTKKSPSADQLCSRSGFIDFEPTFFPDFLHSHLHKKEIESLINEHSSGFIGSAFEVKVSTGSVFKPMRLHIHFFKPRHGWESELLKQHHLTVETEEKKSQFLCRYSAPVGLMALSISDVKKTLREHVEQMVAHPQYPAQTAAGDSTNLPLLILEIIQQYCSSTDSSLVRSALMLHAIHYFMGSLVTFTPDSAEKVYAKSPNYNVPPEPFLSSRLLNRQLKCVMHRLHIELTREVLEGLEKSLRSRTRDAWGPSFAAILVLSLCIEGLQTAVDTFVVCDLIKEEQASKLRREMSAEACREVEEYPQIGRAHV